MAEHHEVKKPHAEDASKYEQETGKFEKYFSANPGYGARTSAPCHRGLALDGRRDSRAICGRQAFARAGLFRVGGARGSRCGEFKKSRRAV